jgi:transcriptional regulator with XRE-family HTH domain
LLFDARALLSGTLSGMPMERVEVTRPLRRLIRTMRTDRARLTQRAAAESVGMSEVWWRQIEGGHSDYATADTLAKMCHAVGVSGDQLRSIGLGQVAELVDDRQSMLGPADDMESYLMKTPGLTEPQRVALVTMAKVLRSNP